MPGWLARTTETWLDWLTPGHSLSELARRLDLPTATLLSADRSYRSFEIPKKSGGRRQISAPNPVLKQIQKRILRRLLKRLSVSPFATGFRPKVSFVDNARCHQYQAVVIRIDLVDFFPSISRQVVEQYFRRIGWKRKPARVLAELTTYDGSLPQGAPTSPILSNLVNYRLDYWLGELAIGHGAVYTRYADDITFSFSHPVIVRSFISQVLKFIQEAGYRVHSGRKKYRVLRQHHRQLVTGLVVNEQAKLPRETRRWLRAVRHRQSLTEQPGYLGPQPSLSREQLAGWSGLEAMINRNDG